MMLYCKTQCCVRRIAKEGAIMPMGTRQKYTADVDGKSCHKRRCSESSSQSSRAVKLYNIPCVMQDCQ